VQRILVTRPQEQAGGLCRRLEALGIEAVAVPTVAIVPPSSFEVLDDAIHGLGRYQWAIFTSANGVRAFFNRRAVLATDGILPSSLRWAAIGPATAAQLSAQGIEHAWIPTRYLSETLALQLPDVAGRRILRIRPEVTSPGLVEQLRARGGSVDEVVAYRTLEGPPGAGERLAEALARGIDGVIFTSASTVRGFAQLLGAMGLARGLPSVELIAIGPVTAAAIEVAGWHAAVVADEHDIEGIVRRLKERSERHGAGVD